ncbi:glycosyltransferase [Neorhizobium sp. AL 9.2.2]|uniref:glycosyltransferase family protein n=1 Tax=Neorhizobium sp. AL 9.2.2 TaxID=2712894 RepID=UPI001572CA2D|nr:glycosyltransferase [Neorhizobium sp. AL 9.2.2]NSY19758.1 glycosyltransferase family 4 protein [Neorhizobium sp. AL 9.2.2]
MDADRLLVVADPLGATQFISFLRPLTAAVGRGELRLAFETAADAVTEAALSANPPAAVVLSRYALADGEALIARARAGGIPTIFHIDDDLLNIPENLGPKKYAFHTAPARLAALRRNMDLCDVVYASTPALREALAGHGIRAPIVAGDLYCTIAAAEMRIALPSTMPTIGYMGTGGHSSDLDLVLPTIRTLMKAVPGLQFETFGTIAPPEMGELAARHRHHGPVGNYAAFLEKLCALGWWVGIAPLEDTAFNRCKADTKWVEYSFAGMATVASDLPVYEQACEGGAGHLARSPDAWLAALSRLIADPDARRDQVTAARRKLLTRYTHERLEHQINTVIDRARTAVARSPSVETPQQPSKNAIQQAGEQE